MGIRPNFKYFLRPIVDELIVLERGCFMKLNNETRLLKFYVTNGVYDKPARAAILNVKNCNGFFGCLKCKQKGQSIKTNKGEK